MGNERRGRDVTGEEKGGGDAMVRSRPASAHAWTRARFMACSGAHSIARPFAYPISYPVARPIAHAAWCVHASPFRISLRGLYGHQWVGLSSRCVCVKVCVCVCARARARACLRACLRA